MAIWRRSQKDKDLRRRVIDLGIIDPLRFVQYQQWHELFLAGPTRSVVGTLGNDFPGLYYYDPREQVEYVLMFDGPIDWRACNLDRRVVQCPDGKPHLLVGLFSDRELHNSIRVLDSSHVRTFLGGQEADDRDAMPDQWEALGTLTRESFKLLPMPKASAPYDWEAAAPECLATLYERRNYRDIGKSKLLMFFETFESDKSSYKLKPSKEYKGTAELISQAGLASSLLSYADRNPKNSERFRELGLNLEETLNNFYDPETGFFNLDYAQRLSRHCLAET